MRSRLRDRLVSDQPTALLWAITAQPFHHEGWKQVATLPDGACYRRPGGSEVVFRGLVDSAGRRWMVLSAMGCAATLESARELRDVFFPERAIVSVAVSPDDRPLLEMWWSVDGDGLPLDEGWRAIISDVTG